MGGPGGLLTASDVGVTNRARILRQLYFSGPQNRAALAARLGVSRATVGTQVQTLLDEEILIEQELNAAGGNGGKPSRPLWFGSRRKIGSVYLDADECIVSAVHMEGRIIRVERRSLATFEPSGVLQVIRDLLGEVLRDTEVAGIGVACAGMVDTSDGSVIANYRMPTIRHLPLAGELRAAFGVPVFVDHHPRVQAYGDAWFGQGRALDSFGSIVTGEVLGLGTFQGGDVHHGLRGAGGEAGHMVVDLGGDQCNCGRRGCWETVATLPWLRREGARVGLPDPSDLDSAALARSRHGDPRYDGLARRYAANLALGIANLEHLLGLGTYIVHGDVTNGGWRIRRWIEKDFVANAPIRDVAPRILFGTDEHEATLLGGAALVLSHLYPHLPRRPQAAPPANAADVHVRRSSR